MSDNKQPEWESVEEKKGDEEWNCRFCRRKFKKFEGWEKYYNIKEYTTAVRYNLYALKDKEMCQEKRDFFDQLNRNDGHQRMWCPKSFCVEHCRTFKHRSAYYRHCRKYHNNLELKEDELIWKKRILKKMQKRLDELAELGHNDKDIEFLIYAKKDSDNEDECPMFF